MITERFFLKFVRLDCPTFSSLLNVNHQSGIACPFQIKTESVSLRIIVRISVKSTSPRLKFEVHLRLFNLMKSNLFKCLQNLH